MKRIYETEESDQVIFFKGKEIEHTPAFGMQTLFVVGLQSTDQIIQNLTGCDHIFFGANHSFNPETAEDWRKWEIMIYFFLEKGYLCSLDVPISHVENFHEISLCEHNNFIPQIRVPIPYIKLWNYNTMLKIDDKGFNATNPGVWTHSLHKLMHRDCFTDWNKYSNDKVIK